uniref:Uncharacterized protein n=1 Tax=Marseillevirus LCMAC102 TaxID=2506603 RepID=A0A481YU83_9VIRU|nr:MAG: hypothetical protein LCMAC102_02920 [Marseillevirus LCMAC102]
MMYVPISTFGYTFALGIFNTEKKELKEECNIKIKDETDFKKRIFSDQAEDEYSFWEDCDIRKIEDYSHMILLITQYCSWVDKIKDKHGIMMVTPIRSLLIGLDGGGHDGDEKYKPSLEYLAQKYPLF